MSLSWHPIFLERCEFWRKDPKDPKALKVLKVLKDPKTLKSHFFGQIYESWAIF